MAEMVTISQARTAVEYVGSANYEEREWTALEYLARCARGEQISIQTVAEEREERNG